MAGIGERIRSVCVFCGSSGGSRPAYAAAARQVGERLARRGLRLVYGGGRVGLMGAVADGALAAGGAVIGVIPEALMRRELAHAGLTELYVVASMHERKALMAEAADAFIALPGGYGTLEEFCEVLTWAQLGIHRKPIGLLNVAGYFDPLIAMLEHGIQSGFIRRGYLEPLLCSHEPDELISRLLDYRPTSHGPRWIKLDQA